jgi:hypothetical protein
LNWISLKRQYLSNFELTKGIPTPKIIMANVWSLGMVLHTFLTKHQDITNFQLIKGVLLLNIIMEIGLNYRKVFRRI